MSNFSLSCLSFFLDLQTYYPPGLHIRRTTFIKFMPDRIASRLPPLDLRKKKGKVHPHNKPMPNKGPKDNIALCPFPYYWSRNFAKEVTTKSIELKPSVQFDQNDAMLFYYKDMYENSCLASILDQDKEDNFYLMCMVHILRPTKIYCLKDWQMCFLRQEGDNEFYQCLIHDTLHSEFVFNKFLIFILCQVLTQIIMNQKQN